MLLPITNWAIVSVFLTWLLIPLNLRIKTCDHFCPKGVTFVGAKLQAPKLGSNHHRRMSHHIGRSKLVQEVQELPGCFLLVVSPRLACEIVQLNSGHLWKSAAQASSATTQPAALQFRNANFTPRVSQASVVAPVPLLLCGTFAPTVCYRVAHRLSEPSSRTPVLRSTCLEHRTLPPSTI